MSFTSLIKALSQGKYRGSGSDVEAYYENTRRLDALGVNLPGEVRLLELRPSFASLAIDVVTEVLVPEGFTSASLPDSVLEGIKTVWHRSNMDTAFPLAASDAMVTGAAFWVVTPGATPEEPPSVRALSRDTAVVRLDGQDRVLEGLAIYKLDGGLGATFYRSGGVEFYVADTHATDAATGGSGPALYNLESLDWRPAGPWRKDSWDTPCIVPMFNRSRLDDRYGRSDLEALKGLIDACSRTLTALQLAQESEALPLKVIFGDGLSEKISAQVQSAGRLALHLGRVITGPSDGKIQRVSGADLTSFHSTFKMYALQLSAQTGIPPHMLGISADSNPSSAEALRAAKDRLTMRAERKQRMFSDALETVGHLIARAQGYKGDDLATLEVRWRDPATASASAQAALALQAHSQGVLSAETAREFLSLSPEQSERERAVDQDKAVMAGDLLPMDDAGDSGALTAPQVTGSVQKSEV